MALKRRMLQAARLAGVSALVRRATGSHLRILCYHGAWLLPGNRFGNRNFITPALFEDRMARLRRSGQPVLPLSEAVTRLADGTLPRAAVVITIDDGWASIGSHMLPVLEAHRLPATLYATTWYSCRDLPIVNVAVDYLKAAAGRPDLDRDAAIADIESLPVADRLEALRAFGRSLGVAEDWLEHRQFHLMSPAELRDARARGLDIQLHSHRHRNFTNLIDDLACEIADNRRALEAALGAGPFDHFCFPGGYTHPAAAGILRAAGIRSATLTAPGLNPPGSDPLALRRLLDGDAIDREEFDAYLSGTTHWLARLRAGLGQLGFNRPASAAMRETRP